MGPQGLIKIPPGALGLNKNNQGATFLKNPIFGPEVSTIVDLLIFRILFKI